MCIYELLIGGYCCWSYCSLVSVRSQIPANDEWSDDDDDGDSDDGGDDDG